MVAVYEYRPDYAVPPGWVLEERLEAQGISQAEFARQCGCSQKLISEIISGKTPLERETALQFERVLGVDANLWLGIEADYRRQLKKKYSLSWQKTLFDKFSQWFQRVVNYFKSLTTLISSLNKKEAFACIFIFGVLGSGVYFGYHYIVKPPTLAEGNGQEVPPGFSPSKSGGDEPGNTHEDLSSVAPASNQVETGGRKNANTPEDVLMRAKQGDAEAQFTAGEMYYQGEVVSRDYVEAYMWFILAAERGHGKARENLNMMINQRKINSDQIAKAERKAREMKKIEG